MDPEGFNTLKSVLGGTGQQSLRIIVLLEILKYSCMTKSKFIFSTSVFFNFPLNFLMIFLLLSPSSVSSFSSSFPSAFFSTLSFTHQLFYLFIFLFKATETFQTPGFILTMTPSVPFPGFIFDFVGLYIFSYV